MEDVFYYNELYDLYGSLLTDKQRKYYEDYYFNDLSLSEMAEDYEVSRNAIFKQVKIVVDKLKEYENNLKLYEKKNKINEIINNVDDEIIKKQLEDLF